MQRAAQYQFPLKNQRTSDFSACLPRNGTFDKLQGSYKHKEELSSDSTLILLYATNLMLTKNTSEALNIIQNYGFKVTEDELLQANLHKLYTVIMINEKNTIDATKHLKLSEQLYTKQRSLLGVAICKFLEA